MDERLLQAIRGKPLVFSDYNDMAARIDDPDLPVTADSVIVLQNAGPLGGPGMPEWGMLPIPKKLLEQGVRDMVRISDARMSGTSYGACILHVAPESFVGGPLALVQDGDIIELDVPDRRLSSEGVRRGAGPPARRVEAATARPTPGALAPSTPATCSRPTRDATSTSSKAPLRPPSPRSTERSFIDPPPLSPPHAGGRETLCLRP